MACHQMRNGAIFFGVLLIVSGVVLLLAGMHLIGDLSQYWPVALIALGVAQMVGRTRSIRARRSGDRENRYGSPTF